ncbi:hypothetical protein AB0I51_12695 [Streptomyces sp. NPDC050549]|uniref:hypothetical protein n=1 Tax=Streptomyces sp. NPDC050549 TaxID=3155406 RepID=UPI003426320D
MKVWSVRRNIRPGGRTGAALVVLLAALMHLLACAHGPGPAGADAIRVVSAASLGPSSRSAAEAYAEGQDPAEGGGHHCSNLDEPTTQPPRDITPLAEAVAHVLPAEGIDALSGGERKRPPRFPDPAASSVEPERSQLGVWRT